MMDVLQWTFNPLFCDVPSDWQEAVSPFFSFQDAEKIFKDLQCLYDAGEEIFPPRHLIFNALKSTPFSKVKAVILGQDPYHGPGQAMGLAFAVPDDVKTPPSLKNIFKEFKADLKYEATPSNTLASWTQNGVLLLNTVLTVQSHKAASHRNIGWQNFTDAVIQAVSSKQTPVAFMLFGNDAIKCKRNIDCSRHVVFETTHPSPLSAYAGFLGSRPFSTVNAKLRELKQPEIKWI